MTEEKKGRIEIKDLNVDLEELKKIDPDVLKMIRGGKANYRPVMKSASGGGGLGISYPSGGNYPGEDTMFCCTGDDSGCHPGADTMFCCTGDNSGCHPFSY